MTHTKTPWKVVSGCIDTIDDKPIARMVRDDSATKAGIYPVERDNNAKFIVTACNSHYDLLEALKSATEALSDFQCEDVKHYQAIISKAERTT
jgi:hypothetical protein